MVVRFHGLGWRPCRPAAFISRQTRFGETWCPSVISSACTRRTPGLPRSRSYTCLITASGPTSSCSRGLGARLRQAW
jgi:hypothetical protein